MIQCDQCFRIHKENTKATHCDCGASIDDHCNDIACAKCHLSLYLESGREWPQQKLYCWACAHERIGELEAQLEAIAALLKP